MVILRQDSREVIEGCANQKGRTLQHCELLLVLNVNRTTPLGPIRRIGALSTRGGDANVRVARLTLSSITELCDDRLGLHTHICVQQLEPFTMPDCTAA